jgi:lysophospholipase L1-like esterase
MTARHHVPFVDVWDVLDPHRVSGLLLPDELHPSPKAHRLVAKTLHAAIVELERPYRP